MGSAVAEPPTTGQPDTLEALLEAALDALEAGAEGGCIVCGGETIPVVRRSGARAQACRECGSVLEDL